ncbi:hypothetical protein D3C81_1418010 [compost metagenome]
MHARDAADEEWIETAMLDPMLQEVAMQQGGFLVAGAQPVGQHIHDDAALRRTYQGFLDQVRGRIIREDISLEIDFLIGFIEGFDQRRKVFAATVQELDIVIACEAD